MANRNSMGSPVEAGLVTRAARSLRYVLTGEAPDWFGPSEPLAPQAPQTAGRMFDYMPGINLNTRPRQEAQGGIDFEQLRALADGYDLLRLVIETRKDQIARLDWCVRRRIASGGGDPRIAQATALFRFPDREHDWSAWLRMLVEDLLVIDAPTIYPRRTQGGDLYALDIIDGATIKRILDEQGRTPLPPDPAYQQVLKGIPTSDYTRDELLYLPRNPRSHKVYGLSPVEQVVVTVNIALRRQMHQLAYYTEGNVPEALIGVPETWTPDQIGQFQAYWDTLLEGDLAQRRHARFVPATISKSFIQTKEAALTDAYDGWLARIICYAFSVSYQALTTDVNRATAETAEMQAQQEGLAPLAQWVKGVMDRVLALVLGWPDLEFAWATEADVDPLTQAQVNQIYLTTGVLTAAEVRAGLGFGKALGKFGKDAATWDEDLHPRAPNGEFTFGDAVAVGRAALGALPEVTGAAAAGAIAGAAVMLIPGNIGQTSEGTLPDHPDINYRFAEGQLTVIRTDADGNKIVLFDGVPDFNGDYRTKDGILIGHQADGGVQLDAAAISEARKPGNGSKASVQPADTQGTPSPDDDPGDDDRKTNPTKSDSPVWRGFANAGNGRKTSGTGSKKAYYEWDALHNDIEVYNSRGEHMGSMDPVTGKMIKPKVSGRRIKL